MGSWKAEARAIYGGAFVGLVVFLLCWAPNAPPSPLFWGIVTWVIAWALMRVYAPERPH